MNALLSDCRAAVPEPPPPDVLLRRLTASLAHNVNNALTGVVGYLELALSRSDSRIDADACVRSGLECAHQAADAVRRIVGCAGRLSEAAPLAPQSLRRLAEEAVERLSREAPSVKTVVVGACAGQVLVRADLVGQALDGLLHAVASHGAGALTLRLAEEDDRSTLSVEGGFSGADLPLHLLEPSLMVEILDGALEVHSAPGEPASVQVSFPCRAQTPVRRDEAQTAPSCPHLPAALGLLRRAV